MSFVLATYKINDCANHVLKIGMRYIMEPTSQALWQHILMAGFVNLDKDKNGLNCVLMYPIDISHYKHHQD
jgi:hypothetical protein